jgi:hypothetical protein
MAKKEVFVGVRLDAEMAAWLRRAAAKSHIPVSQLIRMHLRERFEKRHA